MATPGKALADRARRAVLGPGDDHRGLGRAEAVPHGAAEPAAELVDVPVGWPRCRTRCATCCPRRRAAPGWPGCRPAACPRSSCTSRRSAGRPAGTATPRTLRAPSRRPRRAPRSSRRRRRWSGTAAWPGNTRRRRRGRTRSTSALPANNTMACGTSTALGSPLVPEVKIIMNVSSAADLAMRHQRAARQRRRSAQSAVDTSMTVTPGRSGRRADADVRRRSRRSGSPPARCRGSGRRPGGWC